MKKSFYLKYLEQQGITNKKNKVKKSDVEARGSDFFMSKFRAIFKIIYYIFLSIVISIALTVIVNPSIREIFINLLQGTEFMPNLEDKILFLEDDSLVGKAFQVEFDRDLQSLIHLPNFNKIKGLVLGRAEIESKMAKEKWVKIIRSKKELENIPVIADCDFGHTTPIFTFPIGGVAKLTVNTAEISLKIRG